MTILKGATMKIMGLDMSTTATGWAFFNEDLEDYGVLRANEKYMYERLLHMKQMIKEIFEFHKPDMVVIEEVPISGSGNLSVGKSLCTLQGIIISVCDDLGISFKMVEPSHWRAKVGIHKSTYTCQKCDSSFESKSGLKHLECPKCGNTAFSRFNKDAHNTREELKFRAVALVNEMFGLEFVYKKNSKKSDDDIAESILIGLSEREKYGNL